MTPRRLACYVSAGSHYDWGCYAVVVIDQDAARTLLAMRRAFLAARAACPDVAHVDVWDSRVHYLLGSADDDFEPDDDFDEWTASDIVFRHPVRTDVDMAVLTETGVFWTATTKGDVPLETPEITWTQLEEVGGGAGPSGPRPDDPALTQAGGAL